MRLQLRMYKEMYPKDSLGKKWHAKVGIGFCISGKIITNPAASETDSTHGKGHSKDDNVSAQGQNLGRHQYALDAQDHHRRWVYNIYTQ